MEIALLANPGQCKVTLQAWPWNSITHDRPAPKKGKNPTNSVNTFFIIIYLFSGKPSSGRMFGSLMALQHLRKRLNYPVFATEISQFPAAVGLASSPSRWCCDPSPAQIIPPFWASNLQPGCELWPGTLSSREAGAVGTLRAPLGWVPLGVGVPLSLVAPAIPISLWRSLRYLSSCS